MSIYDPDCPMGFGLIGPSQALRTPRPSTPTLSPTKGGHDPGVAVEPDSVLTSVRTKRLAHLPKHPIRAGWVEPLRREAGVLHIGTVEGDVREPLGLCALASLLNGARREVDPEGAAGPD